MLSHYKTYIQIQRFVKTSEMFDYQRLEMVNKLVNMVLTHLKIDMLQIMLQHIQIDELVDELNLFYNPLLKILQVI